MEYTDRNILKQIFIQNGKVWSGDIADYSLDGKFEIKPAPKHFGGCWDTRIVLYSYDENCNEKNIDAIVEMYCDDYSLKLVNVLKCVSEENLSGKRFVNYSDFACVGRVKKAYNDKLTKELRNVLYGMYGESYFVNGEKYFADKIMTIEKVIKRNESFGSHLAPSEREGHHGIKHNRLLDVKKIEIENEFSNFVHSMHNEKLEEIQTF